MYLTDEKGYTVSLEKIIYNSCLLCRNGYRLGAEYKAREYHS